jgi:hypothetical protein
VTHQWYQCYISTDEFIEETLLVQKT